MSYLMTHLIIANEYYKRTDINIENKAHFLLGNLAPDAVHMREDYTPAYKECSHVLPTHIRWGHVRTAEQVEAWRRNICKFYRENMDRSEQDYIFGYTMHMLTDDYNCVKIFGPAINASNLSFTEFMKIYREEAIALDNYLYHNYSESKALFELLLDTKAVDMPGMITADETHEMLCLYDRLFKESKNLPVEHLKIFTLEATKDFVESALEWIDRAVKVDLIGADNE